MPAGSWNMAQDSQTNPVAGAWPRAENPAWRRKMAVAWPVPTQARPHSSIRSGKTNALHGAGHTLVMGAPLCWLPILQG